MINTVYKKFLKFSKTSGNKRKQTWYDQAHVLNDKIKKGVFVWTCGTGQFEKLKAKYDIKMTDDEKNLHHNNCFGNSMMKSSDAVDFAWAKNFVRKENFASILPNGEKNGKYVINDSRVWYNCIFYWLCKYGDQNWSKLKIDKWKQD